MRPSGSWPTSVSKAMRCVRAAARWLDRQPLPLVITAGTVLGLGIGLPGFLYLRSPLWVVLWGGLLVTLWRLSSMAEPVFEEENPVAARPQRVRDGPFVMMALPGGSFLMGSPDTDDMAHDDEKPQHEVTVSGFRIAITPVTHGCLCRSDAEEAPTARSGETTGCRCELARCYCVLQPAL